MNKEDQIQTQNKNNFGDNPADLMSDGGFDTVRGEVVQPDIKEKETLATPANKKEIFEPTSGVGLLGSPNRLSNNQIEELYQMVAKKTATYDAEAEKDPQSEFETKEQITWTQMVTRHMDCNDRIMLYLGQFGAFCFGAALPAFCLLFGGMIDGLGATGTDSSDNSSGYESLQTQAKYMIMIGFGVYLVSWFQVSMFAVFSESISFKTRVNYFQACLEKDADFYDRNNPTEMASKISKEISAIQRGTGEKVGSIIQAVAGFILGFVFAFYWGWLLSLILVGALPFMLLVGIAMAASLTVGGSDLMKAYAQSAGYAEQALAAIKVVHTYGQELLEERNYGKYLSRSQIIQKKTIISAAVGQAILFFIIFLFYAYAFFFGGLLRWKEIKNGDREYSSGSIIAIMFSTVFGSLQLGGISPHAKAISDGRIAGKLAYDVIDEKPKVVSDDKSAKQLKREEVKGLIEFKDVKFKYPSKDDLVVLKKFSCVFEAGKTTALVGPSGSGKSTIIQLMERFYDPLEGQVLLDGMDIRKLNLRSMRRLIGYVGQEPVLFNTTIRENMKFAKPDATDKEIEDALRAANAWDFIIDKMGNQGIDVQVGGAGGQLSGGQKQRIAIARAFLKKPKILLLDEATSALDKINERAVQDAIDTYRKTIGNITIIVIAHRLSTIRDADNIVVLKSGELVEMGNHEELLEKFPDGVYAGFCKKQESAEAQNVDTNNDTAARKVESSEKKKVEVDPLDVKMLGEANSQDEKAKEKVDAFQKEQTKTSAFKKLLPYNTPTLAIFTAFIASAVDGAAMPLFGVFLAKMLSVLSMPLWYWDMMEGPDYVENSVKKYCLYMVIVSCFTGVGSFTQKYSFGTLGNNVTLKIRTLLYSNILQKNIGWFDDRDNGPSVLTSTMASDTSLINGVSTESLGPQIEALFAMATALSLGFYYCWQESVVCLLVSPVMAIGNAMGMEFQKGLTSGTDELNKEANLLCGDAICNYKTVQSFGNEELLVAKYKEMMMPVFILTKKAHIKTGFAFGLSQFAQYAVFAAMFYFGGLIIKNSINEETGIPEINPEDIFIALFAIMFGASQAGTAQSFGPEMGKANGAAEKIFKIIEFPSAINAVEIDQDKSKKLITNPEQIEGRIEFKDVWFRYPTRKEDFVLRGLSIKINPKEQVALVGESGCGKSTFVNLLMRFYDVDFGEILLDGVNIKDYNLHDLRKAISLVMQEPIIFNYSILENVLYGKLDADNKEIYDAAVVSNAIEFIEGGGKLFSFDESAAGLLKEMNKNSDAIVKIIGQKKFDEEVETLKKLEEAESKKGKFQAIQGDVDTRPDSLKTFELSKGFETQCGIKGGALSGGQKQRVAIARTIIRKPKVLLLDEATSALDEDSQKKVQQALENAMEGRTTIIIAHRMSTIEKCDKIFVLENGKVIEEGGFEELKEAGGFFANLQKGKN